MTQIRAAAVLRTHRHNGAQMTGSKTPQMQIGQPAAVALDRRAQILRQSSVGDPIEQNGAGVSNESIGPTGDDAGPMMPANGSIHSQPNARASMSPIITKTDTAASAIT